MVCNPQAELEESSWRLTELGEQNTTLQRLLIGAEERCVRFHH
eukprot:SAG31_NODE_276_length_18650_cov_5.821842_6_plen_43_part_00